MGHNSKKLRFSWPCIEWGDDVEHFVLQTITNVAPIPRYYIFLKEDDDLGRWSYSTEEETEELGTLDEILKGLYDD